MDDLCSESLRKIVIDIYVRNITATLLLTFGKDIKDS